MIIDHMDRCPAIAITMGERDGIGPEVTVKAFTDPLLHHKAR